MRQTRFRAWDKVLQCFSRGSMDFSYGKDGTFSIFAGDRFVLMQFTGLKDTNGVDICEGDIIEYNQHRFNNAETTRERKVVRWNRDRWNIFETIAGESEITVIGNIYEDAHLLETPK